MFFQQELRWLMLQYLGVRHCSRSVPARFLILFAGVAGAKAATLSFLVGGPEASFKRAEGVLSLMGQRIIHCGPSGSGLGAKICNNVSVNHL